MAPLKPIAKFAASLAAGPLLIGYGLRRCALDRRRAFRSICQRLSRLTGLWGSYLRISVMRRLGADVAPDCHIEPFTLFSSPDVHIASGVYIGAHSSLGCVSIGEKTLIADGVRIPSGAHQHDRPDEAGDRADAPLHLERISVGRNCWIGANAVILADIGDDCVVGAGAVVTRPLAAGTRAAGNPARPMTATPSTEE